MKNVLKSKLLEGNTCIGLFVTINSTEVVEIAGLAGFDFVVLDMEHGPLNIGNLLPMVISAERREMSPIVRVPGISCSTVVRALDIGAHGIQVPQVNTVADARNAGVFAKYYPEGIRGMGSPRAGDYGKIDLKEYISDVNDATLVVLQCESRKCLENLEGIAALDNYDILFLGPYDMSQSLGIPGEVNSAQLDEIRCRVLEVCKKYNKIPGTFAINGESAKKLMEQGFRYITIAMDVDHILKVFSEETKAFYEG